MQNAEAGDKDRPERETEIKGLKSDKEGGELKAKLALVEALWAPNNLLT